MLVFMTGWEDISCLRDQLKAHPLLGDPNRVLVLTCHGSMATSEQVKLPLFSSFVRFSFIVFLFFSFLSLKITLPLSYAFIFMFLIIGNLKILNCLI